jgi:hypothetical protein
VPQVFFVLQIGHTINGRRYVGAVEPAVLVAGLDGQRGELIFGKLAQVLAQGYKSSKAFGVKHRW